MSENNTMDEKGSTYVGIGRPDSGSPVTRRVFLKAAGALAGAGALTELLAACGVKQSEYAEVAGGSQTLRLNVEGYGTEPIPVIIQYKDGVDPLQLRLGDGGSIKPTSQGIEVTPLPFKDGAETKRLVGEVLGSRLVKLNRSPELGDQNVNVHHKAAPEISVDQETISGNVTVYGLRVITPALNGLMHRNGFEVEHNYRKPTDHPDLADFTAGWAVGQMIKTADMRDMFVVSGFVRDPRLLVPATLPTTP